MMPIVARGIYALHERALHRPTFGYLAELERMQWSSRGEIEAVQTRKLNALLSASLDHSPWHADRIRASGLGNAAGKGHVTLQDLIRLPTMGKRDARENTERIVWRGVPGGVFKYNTGGSSGAPLIFYFGRARQASDAAGRMRARRWWGAGVGEREVYLWGAPIELAKTDRMRMIRDRLVNQLVLNAFEMSPLNMDAYITAMQAYRPKCVYGYATSVALLAAHARERGASLRLPGLKVVCTTGETLYPHQRALIGDVFAAPVANEYGSRDIGFTAHETPQGEMLLMSENLILEVVDDNGDRVLPGVLGEAVITGLCSEAQPFIRYRTGDMVRLADRPAACGRGLHVLAEVSGRSTDFIVRADGTIMHALAVIYVMRATEGVAEFKLIQHTTCEVEVLCVPDEKWQPESGTGIVAGLKKRLGAECGVTIRLVAAIPRETSGKYRYVVSHVPLPSGLKSAPSGVDA